MKHSYYNITVKNKDNMYLIYNSMSGYMIKLDEHDYQSFLDINKIQKEISTELLSLGFLIDDETNELEVLKYNNGIRKYNPNELSITIQTTTSCNFKCPYCYQNINKKVMNEKNLNTFKKFILRKISDGVTNLSIHWFGGEPLLNTSAIWEIELFLQESCKNITVNNSITTNGYRLTPNISKKIIETTSINSIQITIDGPEQLHNQTRKLKNSNGTFSKIIENIKAFLRMNKSNIKIVLRMNLTLNNIDFVDEYLSFLKKEDILSNKNIIIFFHQTYNYENDENDLYFKTTEEYAEKLKNIYKVMLKYNIPLPQYSSSKFISCTFDAVNSYIFSPDLKIYQCSAVDNIFENEVGFLDDDGNLLLKDKYYRNLHRDIFGKEKCKNCRLLPLCFGGCQMLEKKSQDECIPEKYIFEELLLLYDEENNRLGGSQNV